MMFANNNASGQRTASTVLQRIIGKCRTLWSNHPIRVTSGIVIFVTILVSVIIKTAITFSGPVKVNVNVVIFLPMAITLCFSAVVLFLIRQIIAERRQNNHLFYMGSAAGFVEGILSNNNFDKKGSFRSNQPSDSQALLSFNTKWEMPEDSLFIEKHLGSGRYGQVYKARVTSAGNVLGCDEAAVKQVNTRTDVAELNALVAELTVLVHLGSHLNVVNLIGAMSKDIMKGNFRLVVEYCRNGTLKDFLTQNRIVFLVDELDADGNLKPKASTSSAAQHKNAIRIKSGTVSNAEMRGLNIRTMDLIEWSFQIASGMNFLSSKKVVHGDVAARNILLADDNVVKIADLGFATKSRRRIDVRNRNNNGAPASSPVKWMAIESIKHQYFSHKSDVWSFGVTMWELFTLGQDPYREVNSAKLLGALEVGLRLDKPVYAPNVIRDMMSACWHWDPLARPTFKQCEQTLASMMEPELLEGYAKTYDQYGYVDINGPAPAVSQNMTRINNSEPVAGQVLQDPYLEVQLWPNATSHQPKPVALLDDE